MTPKEAIDIIRYTFLNVDNHLNDGGPERSAQDIHDALVLACSALCNHSLPSNLDEVTMDFARELDFFLYGSYTPERFPNSMQVRDEHSGLKVNDWKCWVNRPELKIEMVKHFFTLGKQSGAEWMAGQGETL